MRTVVEEAKKDLIYPPPSSSSDLRQQEHLLLLFTLLPHFIKYASSRLANYHAEFPEGGAGFEALVGLSLRAEQVLQSREVSELAVRAKESGLKVPHTGAGGLASTQMLMGPKTRVEGYVRTAVKKAFSNVSECSQFFLFFHDAIVSHAGVMGVSTHRNHSKLLSLFLNE